MRINEGDSQLYIANMLDMLRRYQRQNKLPEFKAFMKDVENAYDLVCHCLLYIDFSSLSFVPVVPPQGKQDLCASERLCWSLSLPSLT